MLYRDPSQHASLQEKIESQSTAYYATARLWDDGIIKPTETRDVLGLALGLSATSSVNGRLPEVSTTPWDRNGRGMGVFRM